jgi:hypothetical protein
MRFTVIHRGLVARLVSDLEPSPGHARGLWRERNDGERASHCRWLGHESHRSYLLIGSSWGSWHPSEACMSRTGNSPPRSSDAVITCTLLKQREGTSRGTALSLLPRPPGHQATRLFETLDATQLNNPRPTATGLVGPRIVGIRSLRVPTRDISWTRWLWWSVFPSSCEARLVCCLDCLLGYFDWLFSVHLQARF